MNDVLITVRVIKKINFCKTGTKFKAKMIGEKQRE